VNPVLTVGHSTHPIEQFLAILAAHRVEYLADVRTIPKSRRNPQFQREALQRSLDAVGIRYTHMPGLGGLRHPRSDSINSAWRNDSFRGYADYMQTQEFERSLTGLIEIAAGDRTAIMCAEAVPWHCHRSLIGDALIAREVAVEHIMSVTRSKPHTLTPFARIEGARVTYPGVIQSAQLDRRV
jgi:uncharacterized protein (DUF488 family)